MSWDYGFRPYVSVAERRRQAQREMERRRKKGLKVAPIVINGRIIAKTFWGKAWCENLESYSDFANRLPRGRTYVRNGSVVHLELRPGKVSALVSGSALYSVEITITSLPAPDWERVKRACAGQIGSLVELLQGQLSRSVMDVVTRRGEGLFPKPAEIRMECSCPDWAGMCKHVAAVMYGVGARLDHQPDLLFLLRKVDHLELIAGAVDSTQPTAKVRGKKTIATGDIADVFGIELATSEPESAASQPNPDDSASTGITPLNEARKRTAKGAQKNLMPAANPSAASRSKPAKPAARPGTARAPSQRPSKQRRAKQKVS
jgi:uncharacterized Zn finger protein